jgi:hypothetical protein
LLFGHIIIYNIDIFSHIIIYFCVYCQSVNVYKHFAKCIYPLNSKTTYCSEKKIPNNIAYKKGKFTKIKLTIITKNNSVIYLFTYFLAFI